MSAWAIITSLVRSLRRASLGALLLLLAIAPGLDLTIDQLREHRAVVAIDATQAADHTQTPASPKSPVDPDAKDHRCAPITACSSGALPPVATAWTIPRNHSQHQPVATATTDLWHFDPLAPIPISRS